MSGKELQKRVCVCSWGVTFVVLLAVMVFFSCKESSGTENRFYAAASVDSSLSISLVGLRNYRGRETRIFNNRIDFGPVSFVNVDMIQNGDAFLENEYLILDAYIGLNINGSGFSKGDITASRLIPTSDSFSKISYSGTNYGTTNSMEVPFEPSAVNIKSFGASVTQIPLRFLYFISREQSGSLADSISLIVSVF